MFKPISVTPLLGYKLRIKYADGVEGEVDLSHLAGRGVFVAWNDVSAFDAVTIGDHGEIRWNDKIDLCSDALYLQITGNLPKDVFPNLKAPVDA